MIPPRPCLHRDPNGAACPVYAVTGGSYCAAHGGLRSPSSTATRRMPHRRRRARVLSDGPPWTCCLCGLLVVSATDMELHHVTALARGGDDHSANVAPAHRSCNRSKGAT
jgi:5-methylcytosine-specific restriction endonuclease McrA